MGESDSVYRSSRNLAIKCTACTPIWGWDVIGHAAGWHCLSFLVSVGLRRASCHVHTTLSRLCHNRFIVWSQVYLRDSILWRTIVFSFYASGSFSVVANSTHYMRGTVPDSSWQLRRYRDGRGDDNDGDYVRRFLVCLLVKVLLVILVWPRGQVVDLHLNYTVRVMLLCKRCVHCRWCTLQFIMVTLYSFRENATIAFSACGDRLFF